MTGIAGGGQYGESGSGSTYLCLPHDPDVEQSSGTINVKWMESQRTYKSL
jgi:hypothetical protein